MIKQLMANDCQASELSSACFSELRCIYRPTQIAYEIKASQQPDLLTFGYFLSEHLVAVVDVKVTNKAVSFSRLAVDKGFRRQGLAKKLLDAVIERFTPIMSASVWCVEQTGNVSVFEAMGFKVTEKQQSTLFELTCGGFATEVQLMREIIQ